MSYLNMKDYSNYITDKSFPCNLEGCVMKFTNEDHQMAQKKRHDMFLNIGLVPKTGTFTDQTPTPTQFIRNCEEVGLFQDLQNVNPFEEKFREAVDAVKAGQPIFLEKSFQSNPPDDTLHTPNIFPHITDMPNLHQQDNLPRPENIPSTEDALLQQVTPESNQIDTIISDQIFEQAILNNPIDTGISINVSSLDTSSITQNEAVIVNLAEGHFINIITPDITQSSCNMVVLNNAPENVYQSVPLLVKDKIKKNIKEKKVEKTPPLKIPITKCPTKKVPLRNKFSKFSKNALKIISQLKKSEEETDDKLEEIPKETKKKKFTKKSGVKESRTEYLARCRAAASRCREKKKMYILYLEKVNKELSETNKNLKVVCVSFHKLCREFSNELLKHHSCNMADEQTKMVLLNAMNFINSNIDSEQNSTPETVVSEEVINENINEPPVNNDPMDVLEVCEIPSDALFRVTADSSAFDVAAEVVLDENNEEIPLNDGNKGSDIITKFNSFESDVSTREQPFLLGYVNGDGKKEKQMYKEHSYFQKNPQKNTTEDVDKHFINYKTLEESIISESSINPDDCNFDTLSVPLEKSETVTDLTDLNEKVLLEPKSPSSLTLLKPFKKRSLQNKQTEIT